MNVKFENTKYLDIAQMMFLIANSPKDTIYEKHKFMVSLFFLKNPLLLEKLCNFYNPMKIDELKINDYERYNLLYGEERISMWNSKNDLYLSYLVGRDLVAVELDENGYSIKITDKGKDLLIDLKKSDMLKLDYKRAKILNKIFGKKDFSQIKEIIIENFPELSL